MRFRSLASSSAGNAYIIDDGKTKLLIECGITYKKLSKAAGFNLSTLHGCLISHEHKDHAKCARDLQGLGVQIYTSVGTAEALELECAFFTPIESKKRIEIGTFVVLPFDVFHDAAEPLGFLIYSRETKKKLLFATDTAAVHYTFSGINLMALEANYIRDILDGNTLLPDKVRYRITNSHFECANAVEFVRTLDLSALEELYLIHLSDACSSETRIFEAFAQAVPDNVRITICKKEGE